MAVGHAYPIVPVDRMRRLAVDQAFHGQGFSGALLADALVWAALSSPRRQALTVDAKDPAAAAFSCRWQLL